jgi:copper(I)-binding protein
MRAIFFSLLIVLSAPLAMHGASAAENGISVRDPWARATAGQSKIGAAYLTLVNSGPADRLVSASTPVAGSAELHATVQDGDIMRMQKLDVIDLAPGATVVFKPNAMHMMLVGLGAPLKQGTSFPLTLTFASGAVISTDVPVLGPGASGPSAGAHPH